MAVTIDALKTRFPEFNSASDALVQGSIDDAILMIDQTVFGNKFDMATRFLAAHYLAINPLGEMAQLQASGKPTTTYYYQEFMRIKDSVAGLGVDVV